MDNKYEFDEGPRWCTHCQQPVELIQFSGFAGKGDPRPYRHKRPITVPCAAGPTLKESETTPDDPQF